MHKGYAFVQFTNPFDARSACMGEDGRNVFGQILGKLFFIFIFIVIFVVYFFNFTFYFKEAFSG